METIEVEKSSRTILVVDDNPIIRKNLSFHVEKLGYATLSVGSGEEALSLIEEDHVDLVLLDLIMPKMDGFEVLTILKEKKLSHHVPIIVISALEEIKDAARSIEMGAIDFILKPFNPTMLEARISSCLERKQFYEKEKEYLQQIELEKKKSEEMLHVILPDNVIKKLKDSGSVEPEYYDDVAMLFCDIVGYTSFCNTHSPQEVLKYLGRLVEAFEKSFARNKVEKIKTIGDAIMGACGIHDELENPVLNAVRCGLEMVEITQNVNSSWRCRIGIHIGPVIAGVIGNDKYAYDVWGDTVNMASRVESLGVPNFVNLSTEGWKRVEEFCEGGSNGIVQAKGKGDVELFHVNKLNELVCPI